MKENMNYICCLCENNYNDDSYFYPSACLSKHGFSAHCICYKCWWNIFVKETHNHSCPGCANNYPLNKNHREKNKNKLKNKFNSNINIIDLT